MVGSWSIFATAASLVILLLLILRWHWHAFAALLFVSIGLGLAAGMPPEGAVRSLGKGVGDMLAGVTFAPRIGSNPWGRVLDRSRRGPPWLQGDWFEVVGIARVLSAGRVAGFLPVGHLCLLQRRLPVADPGDLPLTGKQPGNRCSITCCRWVPLGLSLTQSSLVPPHPRHRSDGAGVRRQPSFAG